MLSVTLKQLAYFQAVATHGGIAQAARELNIAQPSVAQAMNKLEDVTGLILFERHHARGVTLTTHGREFLAAARELTEHAEQVSRDAAALAANAAGEIRLGCFSTLAAFFLPGLITVFTAQRPGVRVMASELPLAELPAKVGDSSLDLAITYDSGADLEALMVEPLATLEPRVLVSSTHRMAGQTSVNLQELASEPYVMFDAPGSREYYRRLLDNAGLSPSFTYASQTIEGVRSAVAGGFGYSIVGLRPASDSSYEGNRVVALSIENAIEPLRVVAMARPSTRTGLLISSFMELATSYVPAALRGPA